MKNKNLITGVLVVLFLLIGLSSHAVNKTISVTFSSSDFTLEKSEITSDMVKVNCDSRYLFSSHAGTPMLPYKMVNVAVPYGCSFQNVKATYELVLRAENVVIQPVQHSRAASDVNKSTIMVDPIKEIYESTNPFPAEIATYISTEYVSAYNYFSFQVSPFVYIPAEKKLYFIENLKLEISYTEVLSDGKLRPVGNSTFHGLVSTIVCNPEDLNQLGTGGSKTRNTVDYLIITNQALAPSFAPLSSHKTTTFGMNVETKTLENIYNEYSGSTNQIKIKECIKDYYVNHQTTYVLLGGDETIVPVQNCYTQATIGGVTETTNAPSDLFYSCFDRQFDWNADGDANIGEMNDNADFSPDVILTRMPVRNTTDITSLINKVIQYELNPVQAFNNRMMIVKSTSEFSNTDPWIVEFINPNWNSTPEYLDGPTMATEANMISSLNIGDNLTFVASHGSSTSWQLSSGYFNTSSVNTLTNTQQGIVSTAACFTNGFDMAEPCLSESFLRKNNAGALAYLGSSRLGIISTIHSFSLGLTGKFNASLLTQIDAYSLTGTTRYNTFGNAVAASKIYYASTASVNDQQKWVQLYSNPMGDPAMKFNNYYPSSADFTITAVPCENKLLLHANFTPPYGENYVWTVTGGTLYLPGSRDAYIIYSTTGTVSVTLSVTNNYGLGGSILPVTHTYNVTSLYTPLTASINTVSMACNGTGGALSVTASGGSGSYTYLWSNGQTSSSLTNLAPGPYSVTVRDAVTLCEAYDAELVKSIFDISYMTYTAACPGINNGTITFHSYATPPVEYKWRIHGTTPWSTSGSIGTTTYTVTGLAAGMYDLAIVSSGCSMELTRWITVPVQGISITGINPLCSGSSDGSAFVSLTAPSQNPVSYLWSNGSTTNSALNLPAGNISVVVTDGNGCNYNANTVLSAPSSIAVSTTAIASSDCNAANGSATVAVSGGTAPYTYLWSNIPVSHTQTANYLAPGAYSLTVTDNNGCSNIHAVTINPQTPMVGFSNPTEICSGASVMLDPFLAVPIGHTVTSYLWNTGQTTEHITVSPTTTTTYTLSVTLNNGCVGTGQVVITVWPKPNFVILGNSPVCAGTNVTLTPFGSIPSGSTYLWNNGSTGSSLTFTATSTVTHSCTITTSHGCTARASKTTVVNPTPTVTVTCAPGKLNMCTFTANASGGTTPYTYLWSTGATTQSITQPCNQGYVVTVTGANGCSVIGLTPYCGSFREVNSGDAEISYSLYPNPTSGEVIVECNEIPDINSEICIYDLLGNLVYSKQLSESTTRIRLNGLTNGMYIYKLKVKDQILQTDRIILIH